MKIKRVETYVLKPALSERPFPVRPVVCRIVTDSGVCGFGEAGIAAGAGASAAAHMLNELAERVIGKDPMNPDAIWSELDNSAYGHVSGGGAIFYSALSALDIAMLDIKGKALDTPAYQLLGGKRRDSVECYASQLHDGWKGIDKQLCTADDFARATELVRKSGFRAAKYNLHFVDRSGERIPYEKSANPVYAPYIAELASERLTAIRKAAGKDFGIVCESLSRLCPETARALDEVAYEFGVLYMEEYYFAHDPQLYTRASESFKVPLACGEKLCTRRGFMPYFTAGSISVAQPDPTQCGGLSEAKKICDMAECFSVGVQPHVCGSPIAVAAALSLEAAIAGMTMHEFLVSGLEPEIINYCTHDYAVNGGCITIPDAPGIGQELSKKTMSEAICTLVTE